MSFPLPNAHPRGPYPHTSLFGKMAVPPWVPLGFFTLPLFFVLTGVGVGVALAIGWVTGRFSSAEFLADGGVPTSEGGLWTMKILQGLSQIFGMALLAALLAQGTGRATAELGLERPALGPRLWALVLLLVVVAIPGLQAFTLPKEWIESWGSFGQWTLQNETQIETLLTKLLQQDLVLNLIVIAVIPALAEELLFRGWIQGSLARMLPTPAAIWITAVLFSAIHLQPIGFIPRLLLGAGFGYLRWYTVSLWPAIIGHFLNNAIAVIAATLALRGDAPAELLQSDYRLPWLYSALSLALTAATWLALRHTARATFGPRAEPT